LAACSYPAFAQQGTWTQVTTSPDYLETHLLLTDGTVIAHSYGYDATMLNWYKLTPDASGNYVNGTWTQIASTHVGTQYGQTAVLKDGRVFYGGGEYLYGTKDHNTCEVYDPVANAWTMGPDSLYSDLGDTGSAILPNGNLLCSDWGDLNTDIYNPATNTWSNAAPMFSNTGDEQSWTSLRDGTILSAYALGQRYIPSSNQWILTGTIPAALVDAAGEIGPASMLYDGRIFILGATGHTDIYTPPTTLTGAGTWVAGPDIPGGAKATDCSACVEANGKVLCTASAPDTEYGLTQISEYDPATNSFTPIAPPFSGFAGYADATRMLALPNGQVLFADGYNVDWVYTPVSGPQSAWMPHVTSVASAGSNKWTLTGTQLNGLTNGASYGDEANPYTHYPIVYLVDSIGNVTYAKTFNFSQMNPSAPGQTQTTDFSLPAGLATGSYSLFVSASGVSSTPYTFNTVPSPSITSFTPASGPVGTVVTITGTNFTGTSAVAFNGVPASFTVMSATSLKATVPGGATTGKVSVTTANGTATSSSNFTVTTATGTATISSFTPTSGPAGTAVTISGTNLTNASAVSFNGKAATSFTPLSAISVKATVPAGATTGKITVVTPQGTATSAANFTVTTPKPTITNFTPASGPVGKLITITGTLFTGATYVKFNGTASKSVTVKSTTSITAVVPNGATTGKITITTPAGVATSATNFTVTASAPTVTSFTPTSGPVGKLITITGTSFTGATYVKFNGTASPTISVKSATSITAVVPNGATTGKISVTTPAGTGLSAGNFTVTPSAPGITAFSPASGKVGAIVSISGTNFTGVTYVKFNGTVSKTVTFNSATKITATVPMGATTGKITLTYSGGTTSSATNFMVLP